MLDISPAQARTLILDALAEYIEADIGQVPVEDARATKLPISQCKAKDPNNCPYHKTGKYAKGGGRGYRKGQTFIPDDIRGHLEDILAAEGIQGSVSIVEDPEDDHRLVAKFTCPTDDAAEDAAVAVEQGFFLGTNGIEQRGPATYRIKNGKFEVPFDIEADNENLGADVIPPPAPKPAPKPAAKTPAPAPSVKASPASPAPTSPAAPAPAAEPPQEEPPAAEPPVLPPPRATHPRLRPPVAPPDPGKIDGLDADDILYLSRMGNDLAFLANRVNRNIQQGKPGAGGTAGPTFIGQKSTEPRLRALAKVNRMAADLEKMYDLSLASEAAGWTQKIEFPGVPWDETKYVSGGQDPFAAVGYGKWGFDTDKIPGHAAWNAAKMAHDAWVDPAKQRMSFISSLSDAPKNLKDALNDANDILTDIEKNMPAVDEAIENENDPVAKAWLEDARAALEEAYHDAKKEYDGAVSSLKKFATKGMAMHGSIADTIAHLKAIGAFVPKAMAAWQKCIDKQKAAAASYLTQEYGLTAQEAANAESVFKKNIAALAEKGCIGHICRSSALRQFFFSPGGAMTCGFDTYYDPVLKNNFGMKSSSGGIAAANVNDSVAFCRPLPVGDGEYSNWGWSGDIALIVDPKKAVLGVTSDFMGAPSTYGVNRNHANPSLMTDASLASATGSCLNREALTKDLTGLPAQQYYKSMGFDRGVEVLAVGGIRPSTCRAIKCFNSVPSFTAQQKQILKANGIKVYDSAGSEVAL